MKTASLFLLGILFIAASGYLLYSLAVSLVFEVYPVLYSAFIMLFALVLMSAVASIGLALVLEVINGINNLFRRR